VGRASRFATLTCLAPKPATAHALTLYAMRLWTMRFTLIGLLGIIVLQRIWFHIETQLSFYDSPGTWITRISLTTAIFLISVLMLTTGDNRARRTLQIILSIVIITTIIRTLIVPTSVHSLVGLIKTTLIVALYGLTIYVLHLQTTRDFLNGRQKNA